MNLRPLALAILFASPVSLRAQQPQFAAVHIGAFDADAWNGIGFETMVNGQKVQFAMRVGSKGKEFLDGERIYANVTEVGPHAPDNAYAKVSWADLPRTAPITMEWSQLPDNTVIGRLHAPPGISLVLEAYVPSTQKFQGSYGFGPKDGEIFGEQALDRVYDKAAQWVLATDKPSIGKGLYHNVASLRAAMDAARMTGGGDRVPDAAAGIEISGSTAHFVLSLGWNREAQFAAAQTLLASNTIDAQLDTRAAAYAESRPTVTGLFAQAPEAIGNTTFWNTTYVPALDLEFPTISRLWSRNYAGWVVGEWDCFFDALLAAVESPAQAAAATRAILLAQTADGIVPNISGGTGISSDRSQPQVGSYIVWKNFKRTGDLELLKWAYPRLKKWHEWWFADRGDGQAWRDGNHDGLLELGSNKGAGIPGDPPDKAGGRGFALYAKLESGMDDSPMYDGARYNPKTYTLELDDVGFNSLYVLDSECMGQLATILNLPEDARLFTADGERVKLAMQRHLWNEADGIYENRDWNGAFSPRLSPTNFYPLLAGVATPAQEKRMMQHLLDPKEFWGQFVAPTIARNDPAFPDQFYWRGDIWPPTNYLLYEGLNRYHEDAIALEFAQKSYQLFSDDWQAHNHANEQYLAAGGNGGGDTHYTWGALLALIPLEQYIDETPWDGLRFGALQPTQSGEYSNFSWAGHTYSIEMGTTGMTITRDDHLLLHTTASAVIRNFSQTAFRINALSATTLTIPVTGKTIVKIDGKPVSLKIDRDTLTFNIPAGEHAIETSSTP